MSRRLFRASIVSAAVAMLASLPAATVIAQSSNNAKPDPKVGDMAPDFSITTVTAAGASATPFKLSEHRGETVVLAFFPKARTAGCTVQMESYRDRYSEIFNSGKKVTLIGISVDPDSALTSWSKDAHFPFQFGTDTNRAVGVAYGASTGTGFHKRLLYVIDPDGRISYVAKPFNQMAADAYSDLAQAVKQSLAANP